MKKTIVLVCIVLSVLLLIGCGGNGNDNTEKQVSSINLSISNLTIFPGQTFDIESAVHPLDAVNTDLTWSSSNVNTCTVENGRVTAHAKGACLVRARAENGVSTSVMVNVLALEDIVSLSFAENAVTLTEGQTYAAEVSCVPKAMTAAPVIWYSNNESVATVDDSGVITAVGEGRCLVYAEVEGVIRKPCDVTVIKDQSAVPDEPEEPSIDLTELAQLEFRDVPRELQYIDKVTGKVITKFIIKDCVLEQKLWEGGVEMILTFKAEKTYDRDGDRGTNMLRFHMDLYRENDLYCETVTYHDDDIKVGETVDFIYRFNAIIEVEQRQFYVVFNEIN